jgi:hypothetical protein
MFGENTIATLEAALHRRGGGAETRRDRRERREIHVGGEGADRGQERQHREQPGGESVASGHLVDHIRSRCSATACDQIK